MGRHEGQDHESYEGAYEGCNESHEEGDEEGHEVRPVMTSRRQKGLTYLITVDITSCCSVCALINLKGFEAHLWSILYPSLPVSISCTSCKVVTLCTIHFVS